MEYYRDGWLSWLLLIPMLFSSKIFK
jgi:hypothetical protein